MRHLRKISLLIMTSLLFQLFAVTISPESGTVYAAADSGPLFPYNPQSGSNITPNRNLKITFDEPVRRGTGNVEFRNYSDNSLVQSFNIATDETNIQWVQNDTIKFRTSALPVGHYYLYIPAGAIIGAQTDLAFPGFLDGSGYEFQVVAPIASPALNPASGSTTVNKDFPVDLEMTFTSNMKIGSTGSILIKKDIDNSVAESIDPVAAPGKVTFENGGSGMVATIHVNMNLLEYNTKYYVTISTGTFVDSIEDNPYAGMSTKSDWVFTTKVEFDNKPPTVTYAPAHNTDWKLDQTGEKLLLTFNEKVFAGPGTIKILKNDNLSYPLVCAIPANSQAVTFDSTGKIVTVTPKAGSLCPSFPHNSLYRVIIDNQSFRDATGNYFVGQLTGSGTPAFVGQDFAHSWNFTVKADTTAPLVSSYLPTVNTGNIYIGTTSFSLNFNEPVTASGSVTMVQYGLTATAFTLSAARDATDSKKVNFTLQGGPLKPDTKYSVKVPAGVVKDEAGNSFAGITDQNVWTFSTGSAGNIPLLSKAEMDGATVLLTYSETLDATKIPSVASFKVTSNNVNNPVLSVTMLQTQVRLTMQNDVVAGQPVKVSYTLNSNKNNRIQTPNFREAAGFANRDVTNTADTTLPKPVNGTASGTIVVLSFNKNLVALGTNAFTQFAILWNGQTIVPTSATLSGATLYLNLPSVVPTTAAVTVSYTPTAVPLKDVAGNVMAAFTGYYAANLSDTTPPVLSGAAAAGNKIFLTYNELLRPGVVPAVSSFSITAGGTVAAISGITVNGNAVEVTLVNAITVPQTVTITYSPPAVSRLTDINNNAVPGISAISITGNAPAPTKLSVASVRDKTLTITYSANLSAVSIPAASQYTVKVDGAAVAVTNVNVTSANVLLTLASPVKYRQAVTVTYVATGTALKDLYTQAIEAVTDSPVSNLVGLLDGLTGYLDIDSAGVMQLKPGALDKSAGQTPSGRAANKYSVSADKLNTAFATIKQGMGNEIKVPRLTLQVPASEAGALVSLPVNALVSSAGVISNGIISIEYSGNKWDVPLSSANWTQSVQGAGGDPASAQLVLKIEKAASGGQLAAAVASQGGTVLASPADFTAVYVIGGSEKEVPGYDAYIHRSITVDASGAKGGEISVVRQDADSGDLVFVPTLVEGSGNATTVNFYRKENSQYAVMAKSPVSFAAMASHWARDDVAMLAAKYIVVGSTPGNFSPNANITRSDFAEFIARGLGLSGDRNSASKFSDVVVASKSASYIGAAVKAGIVSGDANGTFRPNANITREEMASMMVRAMKYAGAQPANNESVLSPFKDKGTVSAWAKESVIGCVDAGLISGVTPSTIQPKSNATRAQAASMIKRLLQYLAFLDM